MDWSYELLSEPERLVLRRLSVFVAPFTADAALAVADVASIDLLTSPVRKSLVRFEPAAEHVESRFWLVEIVREYRS